MENLKRYSIVYAEGAVQDIWEKVDYIEHKFRDPDLAELWYLRLRGAIQDDLSTLPYKYAVYDREPWKTKGVHLMLFRNDVVLYSIDEQAHTVYIRAVCTKGRELASHLESHDNI